MELMAHAAADGREPTGPETDPDTPDGADTTARDDRAAAAPDEALDELEEHVLGHRQDQIRDHANDSDTEADEPDDAGTGSNAEPSA